MSPVSGSTIRTKDGSWSFGPLDTDGVNAPILLNGSPAENWHGYVIAVANGGQLYVRGLTVWWVWQGGQFIQTSQPTLAALPVALTLKLASPTVPDNAPAGTVVATVNVTMSQDGSQFSGMLTLSDTTGFFAASGMNIVTGRAVRSADDGMHTTTITAHQGGQSLSARFSI
jgi:hypothetical protein